MYIIKQNRFRLKNYTDKSYEQLAKECIEYFLLFQTTFKEDELNYWINRLNLELSNFMGKDASIFKNSLKKHLNKLGCKKNKYMIYVIKLKEDSNEYMCNNDK